jgi:hypothetical protein
MRLTRTLAFVTLLAGASLAASAMAECVYPKTPTSAPNGNTATQEEMLAGKEAFTAYQSQVNAYLECLDKESDARVAEAGDNKDQVKQIKVMTAKKHNAAIDELQARADEFNQQIKAYRAKHKS